MILAHLGNTAVSTVNLAEVQGKLVSRGVPEREVWEGARSLAADVVDFDSQQARVTATLLPQTQSIGLSLGDRACLALGIILGSPVYTGDQAWKSLKLGIKIHLVR